MQGFKGASSEQDSRWGDKQKKLLKSMNFPKEFSQKVDMKKVNLEVLKPWIATRITELVGFEDEVVINLAFNMLEEENCDPKIIQINLTGFLEDNTHLFVSELWSLVLEAEKSPVGIPQKLIEIEKQQLAQKKLEEERIQNELKKIKAKADAINEMRGRSSNRTSSSQHHVNNNNNRERDVADDEAVRVERDRSRDPVPERRTHSGPVRADSRDRSRRERERDVDNGERRRSGSRERRRSRSRERRRSRSRDRKRSRSRERRHSRDRTSRRRSRSRSRDRDRRRSRSRDVERRRSRDRDFERRRSSRSSRSPRPHRDEGGGGRRRRNVSRSRSASRDPPRPSTSRR